MSNLVMSEYKDHDGKRCPVPDKSEVQVIFRDGTEANVVRKAYMYEWKHKGKPEDIIQYRTVSKNMLHGMYINDDETVQDNLNFKEALLHRILTMKVTILHSLIPGTCHKLTVGIAFRSLYSSM